MAALTRRSDYTIVEQLFAQPYEFEYYQSIRILAALRPDSKPFGETENPKEDPLQIQSRIGYAAPASDIHSIFPNKYYDRPPIMTINFLGIAGVQGPLPQPYTDLIVERLRHKDTAFRDFLDIFNHRLASFWYRLQKKHIPGLEMAPAEKTSVGQAILDLAGLVDINIEETLNVHSRSILQFTPLFWQRQRNAAGLKKLLEGYFKVKIHLKEFKGAWRKAPSEDWTRLGQSGQHHHLGQSTILGRRSWDESAGVTLHLVALSWEQYLSHLPGGHGNDAFRSLIRFYSGLDRNFDLMGTIKRHEIPPSLMASGFRLGQTTWLTRGKGEGFKQDPQVLLMRNIS